MMAFVFSTVRARVQIHAFSFRIFTYGYWSTFPFETNCRYIRRLNVSVVSHNYALTLLYRLGAGFAGFFVRYFSTPLLLRKGGIVCAGWDFAWVVFFGEPLPAG